MHDFGLSNTKPSITDSPSSPSKGMPTSTAKFPSLYYPKIALPWKSSSVKGEENTAALLTSSLLDLRRVSAKQLRHTSDGVPRKSNP